MSENATTTCPAVECAHDAMVDVAALVPNPRNPNRHPEPQIRLLAKIIAAQGWRAPITVSNRSGFVVRGHGRLMATQRLGGGNTAEFYAKEGTLPKSLMQVQLHPDVSRLVQRWGRWHHYVDYRPFKTNPLRRKEGVAVPTGADEFGMRLVQVS